jgi:hypothetical protein
MTVNFNGTGIKVISTQKTNLAKFQVTVDDKPPVIGSLENIVVGFQKPVFQESNLPQGLHKVTVVNIDGRKLEIDYVSQFSESICVRILYQVRLQ